MPVNGPGWGLDFKDGVAFTEREDLARRLRSLGYKVEDLSTTNTQPEVPAMANESEAEKPFFCAVCGRPFGNQASLTKHINKMHS